MSKRLPVYCFVFLFQLSCSQSGLVDLISFSVEVPYVASCSIAEGQVVFAVKPEILISFSHDMNTESLGVRVSMKRGGIEDIPLFLEWTSLKDVVISPGQSLMIDNPYVLAIQKEVESSAGCRMSDDFQVKFTVEEIDVSKPAVIGTIPESGELFVPKSQAISVFFSEVMDIESVGAEGSDGTTGAFALFDSSNQKVRGTLAWSGSTLTFQPFIDLIGNKNYTIKISGDASDLSGNTVDSAFNSQFVTSFEYLYLRKIDEIIRPAALSYMIFLYISDGTGRIDKYEANGTYLRHWNIPVGTCTGLAPSPANEDVFAVLGTEHRIAKYDANGLMYGWIGKGDISTGWHEYAEVEVPLQGSANGEFNNPFDISGDSESNIYVTDSGNDRIQKFDNSGSYILQWGVTGSGSGQLDTPKGIAVDSDDAVYVVDSGNNRIQKFDHEGNFLFEFGSVGQGQGNFGGPTGIAVDTNDELYVVDTGNHRIQKFDKDGGFIIAFGQFGSGDNEFDTPLAVTVDLNLNVYVADSNNNSIKVFVPY